MAGNSDLQYLQSSHYVAVPHVVNAENIVLPVIYAVYPVDLLQTNEPLAVRDSYEMIDNVKQKLSLDSVTGVNGDSIKQQQELTNGDKITNGNESHIWSEQSPSHLLAPTERPVEIWSATHRRNWSADGCIVCILVSVCVVVSRFPSPSCAFVVARCWFWVVLGVRALWG